MLPEVVGVWGRISIEFTGRIDPAHIVREADLAELDAAARDGRVGRLGLWLRELNFLRLVIDGPTLDFGSTIRLDRVHCAPGREILRGLFKADQRLLAGGFGPDASCAGVD